MNNRMSRAMLENKVDAFNLQDEKPDTHDLPAVECPANGG